jgi:membrane protease YdiL (CAAX protease family)
MAERSEIFGALTSRDLGRSRIRSTFVHRYRDLAQVALVLAFILSAVWTPPGIVNSFFCVIAAACVTVFALAGDWTPAEMGLTRPLVGSGDTLVAGILLCAAIALIGIPLRFVGPGYVLPWTQSMQYVVWSLAQEFILQSVFFLRLEAVFGSRKAVVTAAFLFALAHIPNPILTIFSFLGGLLFCDFFRRWRNLFPLGIVHAALGLTIAASLPDKWLHHMRVGIGYLTLHH